MWFADAQAVLLLFHRPEGRGRIFFSLSFFLFWSVKRARGGNINWIVREMAIRPACACVRTRVFVCVLCYAVLGLSPRDKSKGKVYVCVCVRVC